MKRAVIFSPIAAILFFFVLLMASPALALQPTTHIIYFGSLLGPNYSTNSKTVVPVNLTVEVGDTIVWNALGNDNFSTYPLTATSIPSGALPLGPVTSGTSYMYIIEAAGEYDFQNNVHVALGMKGTIIAIFKPHGSLTNAGTEFYLGLLYPTYNTIAIPSSLSVQYKVYALITTYYDNEISVSYYDASGNELTPKVSQLAARHLLQVTLDAQGMRLDSNVETPSYKACHIVSKYPITVQYLSRGANSGGAYLALPALAVGKKYVVGSYNDDDYGGALPKGNGIPSPDLAGGTFMIIATQDITGVSITPTTTTSGGHAGSFGTTLSKGQCYLVRSDGLNADHDLSGTIIQASKPIIVISGHEDAFIGDGSNVAYEQRNSMIEQMIPYEYWDSVGYIGVPFVISGAPGTSTGGIGDLYRVYTLDAGAAIVQADVSGIAGGYLLSTSRLNYSSKDLITSPVDIYSTNGHKISVMQYDERSQGTKTPYPSPSMMAVVPHDRWGTSYNFSEFDPSGISGVNPNQYVGIIADSLNVIRVSVDGAAEGPITNLGAVVNTFNGVSNRYTLSPIKGANYDVSAHSFYLHSDYPFICYTFGMSQINFGFGFGGNYQYNFEYSAPAGMQLNTGIPPSFQVTVTERSDCSGWNVCVRDTGTNNPGVKAVMLVDDSEAVYFQRPGVKYRNVSLDSTSPDYTRGELHPFMESAQAYCFTVNINNRTIESAAPLGIIDNNGNGLLIQLHHSAPTFMLATRPATPDPDSIFFSSGKVGSEVCDTFVIHNTAPAGGSPLVFNSVNLKKGDAAYNFSVGTSLPASVNAQDSLTIEVCYTAKDSLRHQDTLMVNTGCFSIPVTLDAHSSTGLISAGDIIFGSVDTGLEVCKTLLIQNIGSAPYKLLPSPKLSDAVDFAIDSKFLNSLPISLPPGGKVSVSVCFHPKQPTFDSAVISWVTDIDPEYANSGKNSSTLTGTGLPVKTGAVAVHDAIANLLSVRPNPAAGNSAIVSFSLPGKDKVTLMVYDLLGREIFSTQLVQGTGEFELPIGKLPQGVYQVRLISADIVLTQKLEVMR